MSESSGRSSGGLLGRASPGRLPGRASPERALSERALPGRALSERALPGRALPGELRLRSFRAVGSAAAVIGLVGLLAGSMGCAANGARCVVGADCASGVCRSDGSCLPVEHDGGEGRDAGVEDASPLADGNAEDAPPGDATAGFDSGPGGCAPNHDGTIERSEVPIRAGLRATFKTATDAMVDLTGEVLEGGRRAWSLVGPFDGDRDVLVELRDPTGLWFADEFGGASYVTELTSTDDLLGVFEITGDALLLRGVASPEDTFTRTRLTNTPAVSTLRFPLREGNRWVDEVDISGQALGVITAYDERYESHVDAAGILETPFGMFEVLRVRTDLHRTNAFGVTLARVRTFAFVSECFGTVAVVRSRDNETAIERFVAAEVRRLTP